MGIGMDRYILQVDDESEFSNPLILQDSTLDTQYTPSFDLPSNTRCFWRVLARDIAGNLAYSTIGTFGIDNSPPDAPLDLLVSPDNWSTSPEFAISWTDPPDSSGIAMNLYKIGSMPTSNYDTTGHFSGSPADFMAETTGVYSLYVWLVDGLGNVSYSNAASDSIFYDGSLPYGCTASSPPITSDLDFTVSWTAGEDTGSGVGSSYDVRYRDGETGTWTDWIVGFAGLDSLFSGLDGHTYYFEARCHDLAGNSEPFSGTAETQTEVDTSYTGPSFIPGDANNNGSVNGLDVIFLVNFFKGNGPAPDPYLAGDANGSCEVNGLDVIYLVAYFKGGSAPFAGNCE